MTLRASKELLDHNRPITADEFERMPEASERFELIDGRIIEKPMPVHDHSKVSYNITRAFLRFDPDEKLGILLSEVRMRTKAGNFLVPDMSYWIAARRPVWGVPTPAAPDLAIEIQSPDQSLKTLRDKVPEYFDNGVRQVWIIHTTGKKIVDVHRPGQQPEVIPPNGLLDGEDVASGFRLPVADLFK